VAAAAVADSLPWPLCHTCKRSFGFALAICGRTVENLRNPVSMCGTFM
jgi:hypothetical protein